MHCCTILLFFLLTHHVAKDNGVSALWKQSVLNHTEENIPTMTAGLTLKSHHSAHSPYPVTLTPENNAMHYLKKKKTHPGFQMNEAWPYPGGIYQDLSSGSTGFSILIVMSSVGPTGPPRGSAPITITRSRWHATQMLAAPNQPNKLIMPPTVSSTFCPDHSSASV